LVTVPVGSSGQVSIYSNSATDVVVDEEGYYGTPSGTAGGYVAVSPARITDTRAGSGQANAGSTLGAGSTLSVQVTGAGGVPLTGVSGVVLNATVTNTTASSFLTAWATGGTMPVVSNLNWVAGWTVPNRVTVPVGTGGKVNFYNKFGSVDLVIDVDGYYTDATASGQLFTAQAPLRVVDTRIQGGTLGAGGSSTYQVSGFAGVPASGATAVIFNTTVTNTTAPSFLTVYPNARPLASDLNWVAGQTIPNMVVATLSSTGTVSFYNNTGSTDLVVDLFGYFGSPTGGVTVSTSKSSIPADSTGAAVTVTATVTDSTGSPVINDPVNFTTSGNPSGACGTLVVPGTGMTDANGKVTANYTASNTAGTCTITATEAFKGGTGSATITQTQVANTVKVNLSNSSVPADGATTRTVTAQVNAATGAKAPVGSDVVTFSLSGNPAAACGSLSASTATTNAAGTTPTVTYTASTTIGFCTVTATEAATGGKGSAILDQTTSPAQGNFVGMSSTPSPAAINANGTDTASITATVTTTNAAGAAVPGDLVMFSVAPSALGGAATCGTVSPTSGTTNASGQVTTTYTASTSAGSCDVTATEANGAKTGTLTVTQAQVPNTIKGVASPSSISANGSSTSTVTATVTDVSGAAVSGDNITFGPTSVSCGTFNGSTLKTVVVKTDATGKASATYTSSTTPGFCNVTLTEQAGAPGTGSTTSVSILQSTPAPTTVTVASNKSSLPADGANGITASTATITATVKDASGGAVQGDPINFTTSGSPSAACGAVSPTTGNTNSSGQVTTTYTSSSTAGTCTITATEAAKGLAGSTTITETQVLNTVVVTFYTTAGPPPAGATTKVPADGATTRTVVAQVNAGTGAKAGVATDVVTFSLSGNPAGACGSLSAATATTNATGAATVTYTSSGIIGFCKVTATEAKTGGSGSGTLDQTTSPAQGNSVALASVPSPANIKANGTDTVAFTATVTTTVGGAAVPNDLVTFSVASSALGGAASCGTVSPTSGSTNASGVLTTTYTASTSAGNCDVTATEANGGNVSTATTVNQSQVANTVVVTASPGTVSVSGAGTSTVSAKVTDVTGAVVAGENVTFSVTPVATCGTFTPASGIAQTNASGVATVTFTAAGTPGFCTVQALDTGPSAGGIPAAKGSTTITQTT
jgi:adhesin/invasin